MRNQTKAALAVAVTVVLAIGGVLVANQLQGGDEPAAAEAAICRRRWRDRPRRQPHPGRGRVKRRDLRRVPRLRVRSVRRRLPDRGGPAGEVRRRGHLRDPLLPAPGSLQLGSRRARGRVGRTSGRARGDVQPHVRDAEGVGRVAGADGRPVPQLRRGPRPRHGAVRRRLRLAGASRSGSRATWPTASRSASPGRRPSTSTASCSSRETVEDFTTVLDEALAE